MAQIFRKQPVASPTPTKTRPAVKTDGQQANLQKANNGPVGRLRYNIDTIASELRKVTWPTREETRNLTIVVIGISVALGIFLGGIDFILSWLYSAVVH
jgi:preprotein translocase subunit SecE